MLAVAEIPAPSILRYGLQLAPGAGVRGAVVRGCGGAYRLSRPGCLLLYDPRGWPVEVPRCPSGSARLGSATMLRNHCAWVPQPEATT